MSSDADGDFLYERAAAYSVNTHFQILFLLLWLNSAFRWRPQMWGRSWTRPLIPTEKLHKTRVPRLFLRPVWCCFYKLLMRSVFLQHPLPISSFWEIIHESSSVIPTNSFLFCCHLLKASVRLTWGQSGADTSSCSRLYLSRPRRRWHRFLPQPTASSRRRPPVTAGTRLLSAGGINMEIKFWKTRTNGYFSPPKTLRQLLKHAGLRDCNCCVDGCSL